MDRFCSGQQSCRVRVVELEDFTRPCPDMFSYLQARYTCLEGGWSFQEHSEAYKYFFVSLKMWTNFITICYHVYIMGFDHGLLFYYALFWYFSFVVITPKDDCCRNHMANSIEYVRAGYIGNSVSEATGCGYNDCPWILEAAKGQQINISLYDFGTYSFGKWILDNKRWSNTKIYHGKRRF